MPTEIESLLLSIRNKNLQKLITTTLSTKPEKQLRAVFPMPTKDTMTQSKMATRK